jgi:IclR family transcriptional regulator, pca regulon regulatory protein
MSETVHGAGTRSGEYVQLQSLERGLEMIRAFGTDRAWMTRGGPRGCAEPGVGAVRPAYPGGARECRDRQARVGPGAPGARARYAYLSSLSSLSLPEVAQPPPGATR